MVFRKYPFVVGEYYHLYNRGVDKREVFLDSQDYAHFLFLMYICNTEKSILLRKIKKDFSRGKTIVDIGAYCLMPNHFHILVREKSESGISNYMRKVMTAYSMYFNKKYNRTGRLFENVFKERIVVNDIYLKYLYSYIHLNPAKIVDYDWRESISRNTDKLWKFVSTYPYSSLREYLNFNNKITEPKVFPNYFLKPSDHKSEILEWLSFELA